MNQRDANQTVPRSSRKSPFDLVPFPCLRCGRLGVAVSVFSFVMGGSQHTFGCRLCDAMHYVGVSRRRGRLIVAYDRYSRRYPLEAYDEDLALTVVTMHARATPTANRESDAPFGPTVVYPRKRRFSAVEVHAVWAASRGRCHICKKHWALSKHGRGGWHIDHLIPHIGGGSDTETMPNFRVACAKCNLEKGRGYKRSNVEASIRLFRQYLQAFASPRPKKEVQPRARHR